MAAVSTKEGRPETSFPQRRESRGGEGLKRVCFPTSPHAGVVAGLVCLLLLMVVATGCGRKGPPRAADLVEPVAISDLTLVLGDRSVRLGWSHPRTARDGRPLTDLAGFVVYRKSTPADCPDCNAAYGERAVVHVEDEGRFFKQSEYEFTDTELQTGRVYRYRVRVRLSDGSLSRPSNEVSIEWQRQ